MVVARRSCARLKVVLWLIDPNDMQHAKETHFMHLQQGLVTFFVPSYLRSIILRHCEGRSRLKVKSYA